MELTRRKKKPKDIVVAAGWDEQTTRPWAPPENLIEGDDRDWPDSYDLEADDDMPFLAAFNRFAAAKRLPGLSVEQMESTIGRLERITGMQADYRDVAPLQKAKSELDPTMSPVALAAVHGYWYFKRLRLGRPLMREYWQPPAWDDGNPFLTFRPRLDTPIARRRKLREERTNHAAAQKVRSGMQKAAAIVAAVVEREKMKRESVECDEGLFEQEVAHAKRPKIEREDFLFRLRNGLWTARNEAFNCEEEARVYRSVFPDPNDNGTEDDEDELGEYELQEKQLGRELAHLAHVVWVRLEGVSPFWGVSRLSRCGQRVYEPLSVEDIAELRYRVRGSYDDVVKQKARLLPGPSIMMKIALAIRQLRMLSAVAESEPEQEIEVTVDDEVRKFAAERGWLPLNTHDPVALPQPPTYVRTKNIIAKRRNLCK